MAQEAGKRILMAQVGAAHGIKGEVRVKPFGDDPLSFTDYGKLETEDGSRKFKIKRARVQKNVVVTKFEGINDRNEAEALNGLKLYIPRERLPEPEDEDEFYHSDLIGLPVKGPEGEDYGSVVALLNFGAGDLIEVREKSGKTVLFPFDKQTVPSIDLEDGVVHIDPPLGFFEEIKQDDGKDET
ncbi:ribosome maturation factor RimM [Pseudovibrio exalbescens]|uniref:ribosome maturation factor RimM n=1 Tax=Pseudovibrio exalbescens TaxID=197461 RepID=UPI00236648A4|nr:ribosome maturation factor RimM [Pseudovibrio exalbescens]MDD7909509.1 ribosome maturation factor RimM [Pseudovibrio exalbescens]